MRSDRSCRDASPLRRPLSIRAVALALSHLCLASTLFGRDCPPGTFKYGPPFLDDEIVYIVLHHYGPTGPIVPSPDDYARAARNVSLIRKFIPYLSGAIHQPDVPPGYFWILVTDQNDAELGCMNTYFAASMHFFFDVPPFSLLIVEFPHSVNLPPVIAMYAEIPAVEAAYPDVYGCPAASCCVSRWTYAPLDSGTWKWQVHSGTPFGPGGGGCWNTDWVFDVSEDGVVSQSPDINNDGAVNVNDLLVVIAAWGACQGPMGGHCPPDLDSDGDVNVADLLKVILNWG